MTLRRLLFIQFIVFSIASKAQNFQFTNYSLPEGLPQSQVFCMHEDVAGYIWMGTRGGGITRFNGLTFETFTTKDSLAGNYINAIASNDYKIWAGTNAGLSVYDKGEWKSNPFFKNKIISDVKYNEDKLWVIADGELLKISNSSEIDTVFSKHQNLKRIVFSKIGEQWVIGQNKIIRLSDSEFHRFSESLECVETDLDSGLWVGTYGEGLFYYKNKSKVDFNDLLGLQKAIIHNLYLSNDILWISTLDKGVCRFNTKDSTIVYLNEEEGLANNHARVTIKDVWGNFWIGTSGGGISKYGGQPFSKYSNNTGLKGNYIYSIFEDSKYRKWIGTSGGGVNLWDSSITHLNIENGYLKQKTKAVYESRDGLIWLGSDGGGLAIFSEDTILKHNSNLGLSGNWVKAFAEDKNGNIYVATSGGGITKISRDSLYYNLDNTWLKMSKGLSSNRINALKSDANNRIWYATQSEGIGFIEDDIITNFNIEDGLNSNSARSLLVINNVLWIGTTRGLNYIDLKHDTLEIQRNNSELKLSSENIYLLQNDLNGNLWVGTEKGLDRIKLDGTTFLELDHFDASNGFEGVETNLNASMLDADGGVWFGTINGLFKFNNEADTENDIAPKLSWIEINVNGESTQTTLNSHPSLDEWILPYGRNRLSFDFIGIDQSSPKKVKYRWKLSGWDQSFNEPTNNHFIEYGGLNPGNYTFIVQAMNEDDVWTEKGIHFSFTVATPYWQEPIFIIGLFLLILALLFTLYRWRLNITKKKAKEREEKLELEKNLVQLEQKALQLQMNPHFIFHTLNSIQELIATKEEKVARKYLTQFSKLMRQILDGSRSNTTSLASEIKMLNNYLSLEKFSHEDRFNFDVICENEELDFIRVPSMILQPFVENAILHGALKAKDKGRVSVQFRILEKEVTCYIKDNGPGLGNKVSGHKSSAIEITKERLTMLTGNVNSVEIINGVADNKQSGVEVTVVLPIIIEN